MTTYQSTEHDELYCIIARQAELLSAAAIAIRGPEPELTRWSHHDIAGRIIEKLAMKDEEITKLKDMKRPWSNSHAAAVIDSQVKRIVELETKLNGWFIERERLMKENETLKQKQQ